MYLQKLKATVYAAVMIGWFFMAQYSIALCFMLVGGNQFVVNHQFFIVLTSYMVVYLGFLAVEKTYPVRRWLEPADTQGMNLKKVLKFIAYGLILWIVTSMLNALLLPYFPEYNAEIDTYFANNERLLRFVVLVIAAPLTEEILFRGKVLTKLSEVFGEGLAIILQGLIFGLVHPFNLQRIYASVIGISFGCIRKKEGTLLASIIMHITINFMGWLIGTSLT